MKLKTFQFNMVEVNCYLLWDEQSHEAVLIDPSVYYNEEQQALKAFIEKEKLQITHLLNTHLHFDHIFGNAWVEKTYGVETEAHAGDLSWLTKVGERCQLFGILWPEDHNFQLKHELLPGDEIRFGTHKLQCLYVPGHSQGSLCFYSEEEGWLFSGDALFRLSVGRTDLPGGDQDQLIAAIRKELLPLPPKTIVYPGHGPSSTIADENQHNPYLR